MYDSVILLFTTDLWFNYIFLFESKYSVAKKNCDITVLTRNMVVRKQSLALNKCMGKCSCGCGIMGILLWNSEVTGGWVVEWWILVVRRQAILVDEWCENRLKSVRQCNESPFLHRLYSNTDGFHRINRLCDSTMIFLWIL